MKVEINGINHSSSFLEDELTKFYSRIQFIEEMECYYQTILLDAIRLEFNGLWLRIVKMMNYSEDAKMIYYQLAPYFEEKNLKPLISSKFDSIIFPNGWIKDQLYCFNGLSGGGKTSLAIMITTILLSGCNPLFDVQNVQKPQKVLYINLEQEKSEIEKRIISCFSAMNNLSQAIPYSTMMDMVKLCGNKNLLVATHIFRIFSENLKILNLEDFPSNDVDDIFHIIVEETKKQDYGLVIIDQNQNIKGSEDIQERNATSLRKLAKQVHLPVVLLSQMNKFSQNDARNPDGSIDPNRITGSALKGTNSIEQQASNVVFVLPTKKTKKIGEYEAEIVNIVTSKGRYGGGNIQMLFLKEFNIFLDFEDNISIESSEMIEVNINGNL